MDKEIVTETFNLLAKTYNHSSPRFFPFTADQMVGMLRPKPGTKILDVATGTGFVAMAQAVGQHGRVIGVDLSDSMLAEAENACKKFGYDNVDLFCMDGTKLDFKNNYFDYVSCSFGLFFMPDMAAALKEWRRVLKPGGIVIFSCFDKTAFAPLADHLFETLKKYGVDMDNKAPAAARLNTEHACRAIVNEAGFDKHEVQSIQVGYHLQSEMEWWDLIWSTAFRRIVELVPEKAFSAFKQEHLATLQSLKNEKGLWLNVPVLINVIS